MSVSANYLNNTNSNIFHKYWKKADGFGFNISSDFYLGEIETGGQIFLVSSKSLSQPDYTAINLYIGWGIKHKLFSKLHFYSGFTVGNYFMNFDDDNIDVNLKSESEFSLGLKSGVKYNIGKNLIINISGRYQIIYTFHRIELSYISIGLGKTFETPKWLREFLN